MKDKKGHSLNIGDYVHVDNRAVGTVIGSKFKSTGAFYITIRIIKSNNGQLSGGYFEENIRKIDEEEALFFLIKYNK